MGSSVSKGYLLVGLCFKVPLASLTGISSTSMFQSLIGIKAFEKEPKKIGSKLLVVRVMGFARLVFRVRASKPLSFKAFRQ
jgi:hypothetical protein